MKGDILNGLQDAVAKAINQGSGLDTFKKDFWNIVEKTAGMVGLEKAPRRVKSYIPQVHWHFDKCLKTII